MVKSLHVAFSLFVCRTQSFTTRFAARTPTFSRKETSQTAPLFVAELQTVNGGVSTTTSTVLPSKDVEQTVPAIDISKISMIETPPAAFQILANKGRANAQMSKRKTLISAMIGGAYVGMGGMLSLAISGNMAGIAVNNPGIPKLMFAMLFPVNLLLALQAGGQLFTGNTAYMTAAILEHKTTFQKMARSLSISFIGNMIACAGFAFLCKYSGVLAGGSAELAVKTLIAKTSIPFGPLMVRAMLCNWLVCLAVYLSMQAKDLTGKYFGILLPISTFVAIGFEHSVANMFLLPAGLMCGGTAAGVSIWTAITKNLIPVAIGNALSGSMMVGVLLSYMYGSLGKNE